jgi:MFS family permease
MTADATNLKNRALAFAFTSSPYMISAFAGSYASDRMLVDIGWPWGFGTFAFLTPVVCAPLYILLKINLQKAKKNILPKKASGRTFKESVWHYVIEFDGKFSFPFYLLTQLTRSCVQSSVYSSLPLALSSSFFRSTSPPQHPTAGLPDISLP